MSYISERRSYTCYTGILSHIRTCAVILCRLDLPWTIQHNKDKVLWLAYRDLDFSCSTLLHSINVIVKIKDVEFIYEKMNCLIKHTTLKNIIYICPSFSINSKNSAVFKFHRSLHNWNLCYLVFSNLKWFGIKSYPSMNCECR